ncbi:hypothetical protein BDP81DRAFT_51645 [Colletotrichum phormii]|uniref:Uncharacterized protein n=1 Tax=Colletotrichum phormii TaxID=359342 RepID=A0AAI9ZMG3_9PEZI|nr:uncharacterized protein BDP81DRAFT_51645 [Colletotrichum phormii]KAK1634707.1 hypothetical protein BDP81DRAFT_51645 [Colletotrichum phormii]
MARMATAWRQGIGRMALADERQGKTKMNAVAAARDIFALRRNRTHADGWPSSFIQCGESTWQSSSHHCYTLISANWTSIESEQLPRNEARHLVDCRAKTAFRRDQPLAADRCSVEVELRELDLRTKSSVSGFLSGAASQPHQQTFGRPQTCLISFSWVNMARRPRQEYTRTKECLFDDGAPQAHSIRTIYLDRFD